MLIFVDLPFEDGVTDISIVHRDQFLLSLENERLAGPLQVPTPTHNVSGGWSSTSLRTHHNLRYLGGKADVSVSLLRSSFWFGFCFAS